MNHLIETRHAAAVDFREVSVAGGQQQDDPNRWLFLPQTSGGSITLPRRSSDQPANQLYWNLHNHTVSTLILAEVSLTSGQVGHGVQLQIPGQVFPALAYSISNGSCYLFLLFSSRTVGVLQLQPPRQQQRKSSHSSSVLDAVQSSSLAQIQLSQHLAGLGVPTAISTVDGHLCIAGSEGAVVCLPLVAITSGQQPSTGSVLLLNPSNFVVQVRRRMGFAVNSGVIAAVPVNLASAGNTSLLVVHEDTSCHQWFVPNARQGFSQTLVADASARQLRPCRVVLCYAPVESSRRSSTAWDVLLVWDMGLAGSSGQSDVRVMPLKLQAATAAAEGNSSNAKLEPQLQQPQQLQLEWPDASLVDAKIDGQQLLLLLCNTKGGASYVVGYNLGDGFSYQGRCQLLQQRVSAEWGMKEEMWSCTLAALPNGQHGCAAAAQVLGQLLVPGQICLSSLVAALAYHGAQLTEAEAATASISQLQARITAAVELIKAKYPTYSSARCWHNLFASYCDYWHQQHSLLGLYSAPGGWVGVVRAGGLLSVLRKPSLSELLLTESSEASLSMIMQEAGVSASDGGPGGARSLAKVRLCLNTLGELLGQSAQRVMTQAVLSGVSVEGELLPHVVELLLQGPQPVSSTSSSVGGGILASGAQQRLSEWRIQRQAQLLFVHEQLAELTDALTTLNEFGKLILKTVTAAAAQLQPAPAGAAGPTPLPGPQVGTLLSTIALHSTRAACMTLQQLLLLIGVIQQLGCVGATPLTAGDQAAISTDLLPLLTTALRSAAVALWLCKSSSSTPVPGTSATAASGGTGSINPSGIGPLWGLRNPTPSGTPAGTPRGDANSAAAAAMSPGTSHLGVVGLTAPVWQQPLAAHLLTQFLKQQGLLQQGDCLGSKLGSVGDQLAVWLMLGAGFDAAAASSGDASIFTRITGRATGCSSSAAVAAAAAAVESSVGLAGRGVLIGYQLFVHREYDAMQRLVRLIGGTDPSEAGLQFILGLSIACGLKKAHSPGSHAEQHTAHLDSAVGHLFRAAAGLCSEEAAPLRLVLQLLRQRQGSSDGPTPGLAEAAGPNDAVNMETDGDLPLDAGGHHTAYETDDVMLVSPQAQAEARLRLHFCQAVLLLFEREGVMQGALAFARAALGAVDAAYAPHQHHAKIQQQAALWAAVFNCASELGLNHDAYTAALSNPVPERAAESARRFVQALVDRGQLRQLLSLPWAGVIMLKRQGLQEPVPLVELVIDKLTRRALHSELSLQPNAHQVLFDFLVTWGNYKAAAAAMLSYARRLRDSAATNKQRLAAGTIEEIEAAYAASTAMLQLSSSTDAWLDPDQTLLAPFPAPAPRISATSATAKAVSGLGCLTDVSQQLPVISLADLKHEAALFSASVLLAQHLPGLDIMHYGLSAEYLVEQLLGVHHYAAAVELIHAVWDGPELAGHMADKLDAVAFALAAACVKLQQGDGAADGLLGNNDANMKGLSNLNQGVLSYTGPTFLNSNAAAAWQKLRQLVELYDVGSTANGESVGAAGSSSLGGRLRLAAIDGALSTEPRLQLPAWLLQPFQPVPGTAGGMAGSGADAAGLLRMYIKHGRLVEAAQYVKDQFDSWHKQNVLLRAQPGAVWLPLQELELLHASLVAGAARAGSGERVAEAEVLGTWSEVLEAGMADHLALVKSDAEKLGAAGPSGNAGRFGGAMGLVF